LCIKLIAHIPSPKDASTPLSTTALHATSKHLIFSSFFSLLNKYINT
jgi:hypothetical protein